MNSLTKANPLTKTTILNCLTKIKIDHSIQISEQDLDMKIQILFDDCKGMTSEEFVTRAEELRKTELFGKLPKSCDFLSSNKNADSFSMELNRIVGDILFEKSWEESGVMNVKCVDRNAETKVYKLPDEKKKAIKDLCLSRFNLNLKVVC